MLKSGKSGLGCIENKLIFLLDGDSFLNFYLSCNCDRAWINNLLKPIMQSQKMELKLDFERSCGTLHCPKAELALLRTLWTAVGKTAVLKACNDGNSTLSLSNVFQSFTICTAGMIFLVFNFNHLCSNVSPLLFVLSPSGTESRFLSSLQKPVLGLNRVSMFSSLTLFFFFFGLCMSSAVSFSEMVMFSSFSACAVSYSWDYTDFWMSSLSQATVYCQEQGRGHDHIIGEKVENSSKAF